MSGEEEQTQQTIIFDSLPYYDNDLERDVSLKEKAERLIARELKPHKELHPKVPPPLNLFSVSSRILLLIVSDANTSTQKNPLLQAELARVESHQPLPPLDTARYQLVGPSSTQATEEDWDAAVKNAHAQLEHQRLRYVLGTCPYHRPILTPRRQTNLALLQNYGSNAWRIHNFQLESTAKLLDKTVEGLKQLTVEVNRDRKNFQVRECWLLRHRTEKVSNWHIVCYV